MRYVGSKASTIPALRQLILDRVSSGSFGDPFGGIASVASEFKRLGFEVHTGDILRIAHCFQVAKVVLNEPPPPPPALAATLGIRTTQEMVARVSQSRPVHSWVYREFSLRRSYFTPNNAASIDGARRTLDRWRRARLTDCTTDLYLRACLIDAVDRVANTAGTYYAHLKHWTRKSLKPFYFRAILPVAGNTSCTAIQAEAEDLVKARHYDVQYLDPPYNSRDYAGYYHLPETLATGRRPRPRGLSGIDGAPRPHSAFNRPRAAEAAMDNLVSAARCDLMVVHYSDFGLIIPDRMRAILRSFGRVSEHTIQALGYGTSSPRITPHRVYLIEQ